MLLIDEVDRADEEFEAFLLEVLSDFQISIPELGTIKARHQPFVVITSNRTREVHDALKRRCLYLWLDHPAFEREYEILRAKVPGINEQLAGQICALMQQLRQEDFYKKPEHRVDPSSGQRLSDIWAFQPYTTGTVFGSDEGIDEDIRWLSTRDKERLGYPTQKPLGLLQRIVEASSNPGDVVLDPFCGCGTAVHAAQKLGRQWIGIDITYLAIGLIRRRLQDAFPGVVIREEGQPKDVAAARHLAVARPSQFELWALDQVDAQPTGGRGPALDGVMPFIEFGGKVKRAIVSVKGTKVVTPEMIRELRGALGADSPIGILLLLNLPTPGMKTQAAAAGFYECDGKKYPRVQILTVADLLKGKSPNVPPKISPFSQAKAERERIEKPQLL